ncbi:MAG: right-handed parallel beta-helix repeat-containing protein, partial [Promethearchaeota archaeon]
MEPFPPKNLYVQTPTNLLVIIMNHSLKRKKIQYSLIVAMMILVAALGQKTLSANLNLGQTETGKPQSAGFWTLSFIEIDNEDTNNWTNAVSSYAWCTGTGSEGDPYLIENVTVTPGATYRFMIKNSHGVYFRIKNCTSATTSIYALYGGINIENSDFGELIGNNFSNGAGSGIVFDDCDNMTVQDNLLSNNKYHGMILDGLSSGSCDENTISENTFINNSVLAIYLNYNNSLNIIEGNLIDGLGSQGDGISFYNYGDNNTIIDNTIQNLSGLAIDFGYQGSNDVHNHNIIQGNTILGGTMGIYFETDGMGNEIIGNTFEGQTWYGLWVEGENSGVLLQTTLVQDNLFSACKSSIIIERYTIDTLITENDINGSTNTGI